MNVAIGVCNLLKTTSHLLELLGRGGLLLLQDKAFPSIASLVTGEVLTGAWWSHERAHEMFKTVSELAVHPDVLACKLVDGKVTFVHRRLWPAVLAVACSSEPWQTAGLSADARSLLDQLETEGSVVASGKAAKEIETRLLAHGEQFHTDAGKHKIRLETWSAWSRRAGCKADPSAATARSSLENIVIELGGSIKSLPWCQTDRGNPRRRNSTGQ
jgi:hypothetical protein